MLRSIHKLYRELRDRFSRSCISINKSFIVLVSGRGCSWMIVSRRSAGTFETLKLNS